MSEKKKRVVKPEPEHEFRCGEVTATIYRRQSNGGYVFFDYSLTRTWQMATGRTASGSTFFDNHEADLIDAIGQASDFIRQQVLATQRNASRRSQGTPSEVVAGHPPKDESQTVQATDTRTS